MFNGYRIFKLTKKNFLPNIWYFSSLTIIGVIENNSDYGCLSFGGATNQKAQQFFIVSHLRAPLKCWEVGDATVWIDKLQIL